MKYKYFPLIFLFLFLNSCDSAENLTIPRFIPQPVSVSPKTGHFSLHKKIGLQTDPAFEVSAAFLREFLSASPSIELVKGKDITIVKDEAQPEEGYTLEVSGGGIRLSAKTDRGAFYGIQTLRQLLPPDFENGSFDGRTLNIPYVSISDEPRFAYRGMHLDVGRHFFPVDFIKKYIDALAMLKMNTFHWHLTEDQGWRIEIKKYPKLQEVAAFRPETLVGHYSDQPHKFDGKPYGGYYTQEEVKEVVAYAAGRAITIIPEIEMPGHARAAVAAYPELGCSGEQIEVATLWGVFEEIYCSKDETFDFLEDVLDEVLELFPGEYIHIGGDEAPKASWESCAACQRRIREEGLADEHELQSYFITRIEKYLNSKGRQIIGWDEILEGGLAPNATVMSWRGISGAIEAAKQGHEVVMTPTSHCYFDYYQSENEGEPLAIGGYLPLEKVYSFDPVPAELTETEANYVLGAQGNIWTEYLKDARQVEYMAFPRILAMSEVNWSAPKQKDYPAFVKGVEHFHARMDALSINYANHLYEVDGNLVNEGGQPTFVLETLTENKTIRYTTDGSDPDMNAAIYEGPIPIDRTLTLKAAVFNAEKQLGNVFVRQINYHKAIGKNISIDKESAPAYPGSGAQGLINGINGSDIRYGDKEWLGYWGEDFEVVIDLGKVTPVSSVQTRFYEGKGQWIYLPAAVGFAGTQTADAIPGSFTPMTFNPSTDNTHTAIADAPGEWRYLHLRVNNYGIIPAGKQGAGNKAWTFIDEIVVK